MRTLTMTVLFSLLPDLWWTGRKELLGPGGYTASYPVLNNIALVFDIDMPGEADRLLAEWEPPVGNLFATIDGVPVNNVDLYFVKTDYFTPARRIGSLLDTVLDRFNLPATEDLYPSRASGWWLMIEGLTPGQHTISYGGTFEDNGTPKTVSVTDHIKVTIRSLDDSESAGVSE